ncbi:MAG: alcohol dehydrogenase catalytic domain-containing protein [Solirubrobacterales bacterium]|jgi:threonine dehydrogenase-like Zn-dependent dehydrogenase
MGAGRIVRLVGPRRSEVTSQEPAHPGTGEVVVRILACGVCASELHAWEGPLPAYPVPLGHEPVGIAEELGPDVTGVSVGDRVTGRFGPSFSDHLVVDERDLVVVPPDLDLLDSIAEPLGCVVEARRRTPVRSDDAVAVLGAGYMGLLMLDLLRVEGVESLVALDPREEARAMSVRLGAGEAIAPEAPSIGDRAGAFDVVIEASGTQAGLDTATELVRDHGVISILGFHQGGRRSVDMEMWNWKSIDVVNAHVRRRELLTEAMRRGLELVRLGRIHPARFVTHRFRLEDVDDAFEALASKPAGFIKAVVVNDGD